MVDSRTIFITPLLILLISVQLFAQSGFDDLHELSIEELMNEQVVSSTQTFVRLQEAPSSVFVVTGDQIRKWGIRRITELIERVVPGAFTAEDLDDIIVAFRGIAADSNLKVLLLLNGHEYNTQWNNGPSSELELGMMDDIKKVEILLGPHSALYGSGALIGVINIITRSGRDFSGVRVSGNYGSGDYRRGEFIAGKEVNEDLNYFLSAGGLAADGYDNNNNGPLNISRFPATYRFYGNVNYKDYEFMARFTRSARALYVFSTRPGVPDRWTNHDTFFAHARRNFQLSDDLRWELNLSFDSIQTQRHDFRSDLKIRAVGEERYNAKLTSFYTGWDRNQLVLGAAYRRDEFGTDWDGDNFNYTPVFVDGEPVNIPTDFYAIRNFTPYGRNVYALFGQDSIQLNDKLTLLLGFRYDRIEAPQIKNPDLFSPRFAVVYTPNRKTVLKAMVTTGTSRVINASNTSPDPIQLGGPTFLAIDKPEKMHSIEFAASYQPNPSLDFSANVYYNSLQDIFGVDRSRPAPGPGQPLHLISGGRIDYVGFEAIVTANLTDRTFLRFGHQHVQLGSVVDDPFFILTTSDPEHLNIYPENVTKLLIDHKFGRNLSVNLNNNFVWNQYGFRTLLGALVESGFYSLLNVNVVWNLAGSTELIFSGYNLLNYKTEISPFHFPGHAHVAERNFNVNLNYRF